MASRCTSCVRLVSAVVLALAGTFIGPVTAQQADPPATQPLGGGNVPLDGAEATEGVYVRDSTAALEKTTLAQRMERLKEWNKAADLYQEVIAKYHDRVVPARVDRDKKIYQYTSIIYRVQEQLAKWPQEGLDVYRARYEPVAAAMLDATRPDDIAKLHEVYAVYFVTDAGKQAAIRLIDLYAENGEFSAAAWIGDQLLATHPNLGVERSAVLYRTALAFYFAGDQGQAKVHLQTMRDKFPTDRGVVRGQDALLVESLARDIQTAISGEQFGSAESWPMFGGDLGRGRIPNATGKPGARLYGVSISRPTLPTSNNNGITSRQEAEKRLKAAAESGVTLGIMPVIDRGEMYFQDGRKLYAVNLESGVPLSGWGQTSPDGAYNLPGAVGTPNTQQLCTTVTDQSVLAIMGQPDRMAVLGGYGLQAEARLVCLDRATGKERWVVALSQTQGLSDAERALQLAGSPLVVGDSVMVVGSAGKQAGFEDAYVICFDLNTGKHRWSTYIASASATNAMYGIQMPPMSANAAHLAYANGRIFVQTNLGAVAALDAYNGAISWLDVYPTDRLQDMPPMGRRGMRGFQVQQDVPPGSVPRKPYTYNPVIVRDGYVFAMPTDCKFVLVYDASTGVEVKRIELGGINRWWREKNSGDEGLADLNILIGAAGGRLYLGGEHGVICLNWKTYDTLGADPLGGDTIVWVQNLRQSILGRPFLTAQHLFLPCVDRLMTVDVRNGKVIEGFPRDPQKWEDPEGPGNIIATADHVIIASANSVNVYTDLAVARGKLDVEVAAAPIDPQPRLRYAEIMLAAGETSVAIDKLDEAIKLLGGPTAMPPGPSRERVFVDSLTFAQKLAASEQADLIALSEKLFERAALAAFSPAQQVQFRLARAKAAETVQQPEAAVTLYQDILSDEAMRAVPMVDDNGAPRAAAAVAESGISVLMKANTSVYEPIQKAASQAFAAAMESREGSAGKLLAVAQRYPNSVVAPRAMLGAADAYEAAGSPMLAVQVLRQMWFKYPNGSEKARVLESMARNYLVLPGRSEPAAAALARAALLPGEPKLLHPLKLPDGKVVGASASVASALDAVRKMRGQDATRLLPEFGVEIPKQLTAEEKAAGKKRAPAFLAPSSASVIENVKSLVLPLREIARNDRVVAWTGTGQIAVYVAGQNTALFTSDAFKDEPHNCAWTADGLVIWSASQVVRLDPANGQTVWRFELRGQAALEIARLADDADTTPRPIDGTVIWNPNGQAFIQPRNRGGRMRGGGFAGVINPFNNAPAPLRASVVGAEQIVEVQLVSDRLVMTTSTGRLLALDLSTGRSAWQVRLSDRAAERLLANDDFTVIRTSDETVVRLAALDTASGELRCSKSFALQNGNVPINMALSADGLLVYTLPDRLCIKDLYKPWGTETSDRPMVALQATFAGAAEPDQLLIAEGRILALAANGDQKYVYIYSLETGQPIPIRYKSPNGQGLETPSRLPTGKSFDVNLRLVGSRLYVVSPGQLISYNLDRPEQTWSTLPDSFPLINVQDVSVGQKYLVIIEEEAAKPVTARSLRAQAPPVAGAVPVPAPVPGASGVTAPAPAYMIYMFRRTPVGDKTESGVIDYSTRIADAAGILPTWQAVEGGFYYLTADGKLHILKGAGQ